MGDLLFGDSAFPPEPHPTGFDGWAFYLGGDTPHVWSKTEIDALPERFRLPIWTRSNPQQVNAATDVAMAIAQLETIGAPKGILVALDSETSVDPNYVAEFYYGLRNAGYTLIDYGSQSTVFGNKNPDGYYWGAEWTNQPHIVPGDDMTQWESLSSYDESTALPTLPFWDTRKVDPMASMPGEYYALVSVEKDTNGNITVYGTGWADNPPHNLGLYQTTYSSTLKTWTQPVLLAEVTPLPAPTATEGNVF